MNASIDFLKRATSLGMQSKSLPAWLDEIQSLRDRIAELERENESLKASVYGVYELERELDELKAAIEQYVTMPAFDGTQETSKIRLAAKYRLAAARKE